MSLTVHYLCAYYSHWAHENIAPRSPALWDAFMFCRAVKNGTISVNGSCRVPFKTGPILINANNVAKAREIFGLMLRERKDAIAQGAIFVPVPSKDSWNTPDFRSLQMLRASAPPELKDRVSPLVVFSEERPKAAEGGARGYEAVRPFLKSAGKCVTDRPIVLVDDIITTGGSMLAVRDFLVEQGGNVVCGIACGKTTQATEPSFKLRQFELDDHVGEFDADPFNW